MKTIEVTSPKASKKEQPKEVKRKQKYKPQGATNVAPLNFYLYLFLHQAHKWL
jgi:hypothetical protein